MPASKTPKTNPNGKPTPTPFSPDPMRPALSALAGGLSQPDSPSASIGYVRADAVRLQRVQCPIEGYTHIAVTYRTNNKVWVAQELAKFQLHPEDEESRAQLCSLVCQFVKRIEGWNFLDENDEVVPVPGPGENASWFFLMEQLDDLWRWVVRDGYTAAKEQALGN